MGDLRHKKSPPTNEAEEDNTPEFREAARAALANNAIANRIRKKRKGDPGYLISNQAELADAIDADRTTIKKLLGGARASTKAKISERSVYVGRVRRVLDLGKPEVVTVRPERLDVVRWIAELPDAAFAIFRTEYERTMRRM